LPKEISAGAQWKEFVEIMVGLILSAIASILLSSLIEPFFAFAILIMVLLVLLAYFQLRTLRVILKEIKLLKEVNTELISTDESELEKRFIKVIRNAEKSIACTGGISRLKGYLNEIEKQINSGREYWRVFSGPQITEEMFKHLKKVLSSEKAQNVHIYFLSAMGGKAGVTYPYIVVTDKEGIIALPDPAKFRSFLITNDPIIVWRLNMYIQQLVGQGKPLDRGELDRLIKNGCIKIKKTKINLIKSNP